MQTLYPVGGEERLPLCLNGVSERKKKKKKSIYVLLFEWKKRFINILN